MNTHNTPTMTLSKNDGLMSKPCKIRRCLVVDVRSSQSTGVGQIRGMSELLGLARELIGVGSKKKTEKASSSGKNRSPIHHIYMWVIQMTLVLLCFFFR